MSSNWVKTIDVKVVLVCLLLFSFSVFFCFVLFCACFLIVFVVGGGFFSQWGIDVTIHHCSSNLTEQTTVLSVEVSSGELLAVEQLEAVLRITFTPLLCPSWMFKIMANENGSTCEHSQQMISRLLRANTIFSRLVRQNRWHRHDLSRVRHHLQTGSKCLG